MSNVAGTRAVVGIAGAGIGGSTAAIALRRLGVEVELFEQAPGFARVGADINLTPNAVRALDGLDIGDTLRLTAAQPTHRISRTWDTGVETSRIEMADHAVERYGAPQLTIHRADLMHALEDALKDVRISFGKKLESVADSDRLHLQFADGTSRDVDILIGADGIHSAVRTWMLGPEQPEFTGVVAYRALVDTERLAGLPNLDAFTKWWGPNPETQIVTFPLDRGRTTFVFATTPQPEWTDESWTRPGDVHELRAAYADFHPEARALLDACDDVLISALYVRDPLATWRRGNAALLGDACHTMMPFMAQGAGQAIEDAIVLSRCLAGGFASTAEALDTYQSLRLPRTSAIQVGSRGNSWLKASGTDTQEPAGELAIDPDTVYGYDAWNVPLR